MKFLRANALIKIGKIDRGELVLDQLMGSFQQSPVALRAAMYLALKLYSKGFSRLALEKFFWLSDHHVYHRLNWVFHLGAAECLYELGQTDRALKEYQWLMTTWPARLQGAEGGYRLGDLYLTKMQYERALGTYYQGIQNFEPFAESFPEYYLNRGETLYQLGQLAPAKKEFVYFLDHFPAHSEGWRATYRLAEIAGREPKSSGPSSLEYQSYLLRTVNQYPFSIGSVLARIRLAGCGDHGGFDQSALKKFFSEQARDLDGSGVVSMTDYRDFRALGQVRTLANIGEPRLVLDLALSEIPTAKSPLVKKYLKLYSHHSFQKLIIQMIDQGQKYEALSFYSAKIDKLPKTDEEIKHDYLLKLSQAASDLSLPKMASDLIQAYRLENSKKRTLAAVDFKSTNARDEENYALAKALWIRLKNVSDQPGTKEADQSEDKKGHSLPVAAEVGSEKIRNLLQSLSGDSRFSFEKEILLGLLDEHEGKIESAIQHATEARLTRNLLQLDAWVASLYLKAKNNEIPLSIYKKIEKETLENHLGAVTDEASLQKLGLPSIPDLGQTLLKQTQILESEERWGEAVSAYSRLIDHGIKSNRVRYGYARSLLKIGKKSDRAQVLATLNEIANADLKNEDDDFWKKMAIETIANNDLHDLIKKNAKEGTK
jgi:tetratricopeptide (TPR) repeat protein